MRQQLDPTVGYVTDSRSGDRPARKGLHAYVSDEAYSGWHEFAAQHRVTVSAIIEVFGIRLARHADANHGDLEEELRHVVQMAARIDRVRRSRSRD